MSINKPPLASSPSRQGGKRLVIPPAFNSTNRQTQMRQFYRIFISPTEFLYYQPNFYIANRIFILPTEFLYYQPNFCITNRIFISPTELLYYQSNFYIANRIIILPTEFLCRQPNFYIAKILCRLWPDLVVCILGDPREKVP